jgi:hypothetical protein
LFFEFLKEGAQFAAGAHGGDADTGSLSVDEITDFIDRLFFEIEEADDHRFAWIEMCKEPLKKIAGETGGSFERLRAGERFGREEESGFVGIKLGIAHDLAAAELAKFVVAGVESNFRDPVVEGLVAGVLLQAGKHLEEDLLAQILFGLSAGEVASDDGDDERVEHVDELACRLLIAPPDGSKELRGDIGRRGIHKGGKGEDAGHGGALRKRRFFAKKSPAFRNPNKNRSI